MRTSSILTLISAGLLLAPAAHANKVEKVSLSTKIPAFIVVYSKNGEQWTDVDESKTVQVRVNVDIECKYEGAVSGKNPYSGELRVEGLELTSGGKISKDTQELTGVYRYKGPIAASPVQACNKELEKRLANSPDKTRYHILKDGFTVDSPAALRGSLQLKCKATGAGFDDIKTAKANLDARVSCQGSPLAADKIPKPAPKPARAPKPEPEAPKRATSP